LSPGDTLPTDPYPSLSIIIPARNEAENLRRLLPSLKQTDYPGPLEIIVVDDGSTDETADIARQHQTALLQLHELPQGWLGKTNACHQGSAQAGG
jgi:glycosyltransferase involved in cell wall biosynthesis